MQFRTIILSIILLLPLGANANNALSEEEQYLQWAENIWNSLAPKTGEIKLTDAVATLNVPEGFYYLNPVDADKILVEVWGNPPQANTLGMLFPANTTPFDDNSWAVTIEYEEDGYVSDKDANNIDYDDLIEQMQSDTEEASDLRVSQGYDEIELIGWASPPFYDKKTHKLHWAKEIKFANQEGNTLNYNIRVLGRKGVLVLNFIARMDQKVLIDSKLDAVLAMTDFDQSAKYSDFDPDIDQAAAYGLGALVAGKVLAKTGLFAMGFIFFKKFGLFLVVALGIFFRKVFTGKNKKNNRF